MFALPAYLWAATLALPLILLHLLGQRRQRMRVASIQIWKPLQAARPNHARWSRLRWLLLLLLHLAALLLFVLGAAQWRPRAPDRSVALVLDNSPSMRLRMTPSGATRLHEAKTVAIQSLHALRDGDLVSVFISGQWPQAAAFESSAVAAADRIKSWPEETLGVTPGLALQSAVQWLSQSSRPRRKLIYVGDAALASWPPVGDGIEFEPLILGQPVSNAAVLRLEAERKPSDSPQVLVFFLLGQIAADGIPSLPWQLKLNGQTVTQGTAEFAPSRVAPFQATFSDFGRGGLLSLEVQRQDACPEDNQAEFPLAPAKSLQAGLACRKENLPLRSALLSLPGIKIQEKPSGGGDGAAADVWVIECSPDESPAPNAPALLFRVGESPKEKASSPARLQYWQQEHLLFHGVDLPSIVVPWLTPPSGDAAGAWEEKSGNGDKGSGSAMEGLLARSRDGIWIAANDEAPHRRIEVFFDPLSTSFPDRPDFPVFISNAIQWLTENAGPAAHRAVDPAEVTDPVRLAIRPATVEVPRPAGFLGSQPAWAFAVLLGLALFAAACFLSLASISHKSAADL